jgi:hypothetical protein
MSSNGLPTQKSGYLCEFIVNMGREKCRRDVRSQGIRTGSNVVAKCGDQLALCGFVWRRCYGLRPGLPRATDGLLSNDDRDVPFKFLRQPSTCPTSSNPFRAHYALSWTEHLDFDYRTYRCRVPPDHHRRADVWHPVRDCRRSDAQSWLSLLADAPCYRLVIALPERAVGKYKERACRPGGRSTTSHLRSPSSTAPTPLLNMSADLTGMEPSSLSAAPSTDLLSRYLRLRCDHCHPQGRIQGQQGRRVGLFVLGSV